MEAKPFAIGKILSERQRFAVPIYQRTYAWTEKEQLNPFFDQVEDKAMERLATGKVRFSHYMGALLVIPEGEPVFGRIQSFSVVDGQQRLTTFCLLFAALRDIARKVAPGATERQLLDLLVHSDDTPMEDRANERYKLQPTRYDRTLFRALVDRTSDEIRARYQQFYYKNGRLKAGGAPLPLVAYHLFRDSALEFITNGNAVVDGDEQRKRLLALSTAIFEDFKLIVITLAKDDDAQVIFETLNSGGKPLAAMDLVRNDVFYRATLKGEDTEALMEDHWQVFEHPFWKQDQVQGRIRKPRIDFYLAHVLAAEHGKVVSLGELYAEYKAFVADRPLSTSAEELERLTRHHSTYKGLVNPDLGTSLGRLAHRLMTFDVTTAYPLVLVVANAEIEEEERERLYKLIASYVIRREICGLGAKNYNNVFAEIAGVLGKKGASVPSFQEAFRARAGSDAAKFPNDDDFEQAIRNRPVYWTVIQRRLRLILEELEFAWRNKFEVDGPLQHGLTIEHVMPQGWMSEWALPDGRKLPRDGIPLDDDMRVAVEARNRTLHTLGNLTLLTPPANTSAGNAAFKDKKDRLRKSLLSMNNWIADVQDEEWTEAKGIHRRAGEIVKKAKLLWPGID